MRRNKPVNFGDLSLYVPSPARFITTKSRRTIVLGGESIDIPTLQRLVGIGRSSLSRFLSGSRIPRPFWALRTAYALGMTPEGLAKAIAARKKQLSEKKLEDGRKRRANTQRTERWLINHGALR